ncbi:MAG TPA: ATP-binding protein [Armatimonadota bacterium]|nr:ATP-binding protein [Armatimonadota bacterium]
MLVEFAVSNFRSFGSEQRLIMEATRDAILPDNVTSLAAVAGRNPLRLLKLAVLYGANASGKSNLYRAIDVFATTVFASATNLSEGDELPGIAPFRLDPCFAEQPSKFEIVAYLEGKLWRYGFAATRAEITAEWLFVTKPNGPETEWLRRDGDEKGDWYFGSSLRGRQRSLRTETRPKNCLLLSTAARIGVDALRPLYQWIRGRLGTFDLSSQVETLTHETAGWLSEDEFACRSVGELIKAADVGITRLQIDEVDQETFVPAGDSLVDQMMRQLRGSISIPGSGKIPIPTMYHHAPDNAPPVEFSLSEESNGTQRLFAIAGPLLQALREGRALIIDEIDCSLHPLLLRELVELVQDPVVNRAGCQLIVTTHDTNLQDPGLLRRDQIWLTEKNDRGMTELFSLYDFEQRPRSDAPITKEYLNGRFGGVPVLGNMRRALLAGVDPSPSLACAPGPPITVDGPKVGPCGPGTRPGPGQRAAQTGSTLRRRRVSRGAASPKH